MPIIPNFFPNIFCTHYSCVSGKLVSRVFTPALFFWSRYSCEYKNRFYALFPDDLFPTFFARTIRVFLVNLFRSFPPPFFGSRYSCEYKKRLFALFPDDLFSHIFCSHYSCVSGKLVSRFFSPLLGHYIRVNIKKRVFLHFFPNCFLQQFFARTIRVFLEKFFRAFFSPHFLVMIFV